MNIRFLFPLGIAALTLVSPALHAQDSAPKLINYQGKLVQPSGQPIADGNQKLRFTLYSKPVPAQTGDPLIWGADYTVSVISGQFNVVLGAPGGTPVTGAAVNDIGFAFSSAERYLQMEILNAAGAPQAPPQIILPRQQFLSVPYALNGNPTGVVMPWIGSGSTSAPVPDGWLPADGRTIGKAGSGAVYANEGARPLFRLIWNSIPSQPLTNPDGSTVARGASADADFDAGRQMKTPDLRSRAIVGAGRGDGLDEQGQTLTNRALTSLFGSEKHLLIESEMPNHMHNVRDRGHVHQHDQPTGVRVASGNGTPVRADLTVPKATTTGNADIAESPKGGDQRHNIVQPSIALTYLIHL